ncbi:sortase A [Paenibacillus turicensis]|uniref:Sortase A n=1 Tax=Paenibacillus turicensis TaxID=160487 RepID=A0ABS4FYM0_9BACL|nr:class D sortase [Paenibacillus turicensis]MBP1907630.1 sortase A [Paenibacillus turicensis]
MKKKLSYLLIIAGFCIMLFPAVNEWLADQEQNHLLEIAEAGSTVSENSMIGQDYAQVSQLLDEGVSSTDENKAQPIKLEEGVLGIISIDSINLKLPILEGATKKNMRHAAAHMSETTPLGQIGNAAIAAHRAHKEGRLFNRLGEVKIGDEIIVQNDQQKYIYKVYNIVIVEPTDLSVLDTNGQDSIVTLITCDPMINPTHRLIVQAKL